MPQKKTAKIPEVPKLTTNTDANANIKPASNLKHLSPKVIMHKRMRGKLYRKKNIENMLKKGIITEEQLAEFINHKKEHKASTDSNNNN